MPSYLSQSQSCLSNNTSANSTACCAPEACQSSLVFFNTLSEKMLDMVTTLKTQFEKCAANANNNSTARGFILAKIDAKPPTLGIKYEYLEYIKRYGPPSDGQFDPVLLQQLRTELGIPDTTI